MIPDDPMQMPFAVALNVTDKEDGSVCAHFDEVEGTHLRAATMQYVMRYLAAATQIVAHIVVDKGTAALDAGTFDQGGSLTKRDLEAYGITTQAVDDHLVTHVAGVNFAVLLCDSEAAYIGAFRIILKVALLWVEAARAGLEGAGVDDPAHSSSGEDVVLHMPTAQRSQPFKTHD